MVSGSLVIETLFKICSTGLELDNPTGAKPMDSIMDEDLRLRCVGRYIVIFSCSALPRAVREKNGPTRMCLSGISFLPLSKLMSPDEVNDVSSRLNLSYEEKLKQGIMPPGLKEQWDMRLQKYRDENSGNCELLYFPLCYGGSEYTDKLRRLGY